ncbi:MAG: hypothetical protein GY719_02735 [bacterium]|nr:hypothetical protein [bacterium]
MRRNVGPVFLLFLFLGLLGGFAWLTQNPETPWLEEAEEWPVVGGLAHRFRVAYLGPKAANRGAEEPVEEPVPTEVGEPVAREPREPRRQESRPIEIAPPRVAETAPQPPREPEAREPMVTHIPRLPTLVVTTERTAVPRGRSYLDDITYEIDSWIWVLPGNRILTAAEPGAEERERIRAMTYLPVLGQQGDWARVLYRRQAGWVDTSWQPSHVRKKARRGAIRQRYEPVRGSDAGRLKKAREILGTGRPASKLGPYELYTDVEDDELLEFLDLAAETAEEAYFARYGRLPSGNPRRSAVLFAREEDYRRYSETASGLSGIQVGHAGLGVLAFYAEDRQRQDLGRTLVHEIGHLLNRRALARGLPPWMEEGMASDLGSLWVEGSPAEDTRRRGRWSYAISGPEMSFLRLATTMEGGELPSVGVLMSLDRKKFHLSASYAYAHSVAFVRYLMDSEDAGEGEPFRAFLRRIAIGHGADPRKLLKLLDMDLEELDQSFRAWLGAEAAESSERIAARAKPPGRP